MAALSKAKKTALSAKIQSEIAGARASNQEEAIRRRNTARRTRMAAANISGDASILGGAIAPDATILGLFGDET